MTKKKKSFLLTQNVDNFFSLYSYMYLLKYESVTVLTQIICFFRNITFIETRLHFDEFISLDKWYKLLSSYVKFVHFFLTLLKFIYRRFYEFPSLVTFKTLVSFQQFKASWHQVYHSLLKDHVLNVLNNNLRPVEDSLSHNWPDFVGF